MFNKKNALLVMVLSAFVGFSTQVFAQEANDGYSVSVTPRVWVSSFTFHLPRGIGGFPGTTVNNSGGGDELKGTSVLGGLTVGFTPKTKGNNEYILTGYYGQLSGDFSNPSFGWNGTFSTNRGDFEFLVRSPMDGWKLLYGLRYVSWDESIKVGNLKENSKTNMYMAELGLNKVWAISNRQGIQINALLAGGVVDRKYSSLLVAGSTTNFSTYGPLLTYDVNAGYYFRITKKLSVDARYRVFGSPKNKFKRDVLMHGPEAGFTFTF